MLGEGLEQLKLAQSEFDLRALEMGPMLSQEDHERAVT